MGIVDKVSEDMKQAMRDRDAPRLSGLRNMRAGLLLAMKEDGSATLSDDRAIDVLRRLCKQRLESVEAYRGAGREDLAGPEEVELRLIESYLPRLADEATTRQWVGEAIAATGATGPKDKGKVMGALMKAHKADLDGKLANAVVAELLGSAA